MKKSRGNGVVTFILMVLGFALGLIIGRGLDIDFNFDDDDDDDDDFDEDIPF